MKQQDRNPGAPHPRAARLGVVLCSLFALCLLLAAPAAASYEYVGSFANEPGNHQFQEAKGIAVNVSGAGGVPVGTIYAANDQEGTGARIVRYDAKGELREAWGWGVGDEKQEFERCGPDGEAAYPTCLENNAGEAGFPGEGTGQLRRPRGIAVDQATGYVYVYNYGRTHNAVQIYSATGQPIGGFGENSYVNGEAIDESPEKFHNSNQFLRNNIAVDEAGTVYISDLGGKGGEGRVMVFRPQSPGDYQHYVYAGRPEDIDSVSGSPDVPEGVALDDAGNLYVGSSSFIREYSLSDPSVPMCEYKAPGGQVPAMTVNPKSGEVFYMSGTNNKVVQLTACNSEGEFEEKSSSPRPPGRFTAQLLAFDPVLSYEESRPAGLLYYIDTLFQEHGQYGADIYAPAEIHPPRVESESVSSVGATSAALHAQIDPLGSQTDYAFQYLTQEAYEANEPDEIQSLAVSATAGVFGLGFEGRRYGGEGEITLGSGSASATSLKTATGTATLKGASGTATLKAAQGTGTAIAGSTAITALATSEGVFEVGQLISGTGIPQGTTVKSVSGGELTLSASATASAANIPLSAGSTALGSLTTSEGTFEAGETVFGEGIPSGTEILSAKANQLTISKPPTKPGTGVAIHAGSNVLGSVTTGFGNFEAGQPIEGAGIPSGTRIEAIEGSKLTLSNATTVPGTGVAIFSSGPGPFAAGERIEGAGIPAETTILAAKAGELTLSAPASASSTVTVDAGLSFDAHPREVRHALETLPAIGSGNVSVSGGPGDETGSSPYLVRFGDDLTNMDLPLLEADSGTLGGGSAGATVQGVNDGGKGFEGATESPPGGATLGTGQQSLGAGTTLLDLDPDTAYRFRVVASSPCNPEEEEVPCETEGAARSFRTFPVEAAELPDRRAYELVSPPRKAGGQVYRLEPGRSSCHECNQAEATVFPKQSSPNGEAVVYEGTPFATSGGGLRENEYVSHRTSSGWKTTNLTPERITTGSYETGFKAFDSSLSKGLLLQIAPSLTPEAPSEYANFYGFSSADPAALSTLITQEPPNRSSGEGFKLTYAGATPDLSHSLFEANDALTGETSFAPEAVDGGSEENNLYESANGELRLVNVLPGNTETVPGATFGSGDLLHPGATSNLHSEYAFDNAISADGSRIFWSDPSGQVYVREDGERTREISDHTGKFLTAAADGSSVLLSDGHLIGLGDEEPVTDLTEGKGGFEGLVGRSEDLSSIYFVDTAVLEGGENEHGEVAQAGSPNLYLHRGGTTTFVATLELPNGFNAGGDNSIDGVLGKVGDWHTAAGYRSAEASPDGRYLAFMSRASLTGVDSVGNCAIGEGSKRVTGRCEEVFLYDSQSGHLSCPSCNPAGLAPLGNSALPLNSTNGFFQLQPRFLTDSSRLYFDSEDSLSAFDTNEGVEDVYQYEPNGVGTCERQEGCLRLISAGSEAIDSNFFASDESGKNVFFVTRDQLALKDKDDLLDIYDAREDGGIANETETSRGECQGEACQAPVVAPNDPTPGSSTFEGAGNVHEEGKAKKKHAKKHKKKRHAKKKHAHKRAAKHNRGGAK